MATLRDIQRRIRSVEKTQQITSAMRMVAAAKLRRAQDAIIAARPYAERMYDTLAQVGMRLKDAEHPLLEARDPRRVLEIVVVTSDRGLCGAFNTQAIRHATALIAERSSEFDSIVVSPVGRKANEHFRRHHRDAIARSWTGLGSIEIEEATVIAEHLSTRFLAGEIDEAVIVANEFVSALTQRPATLQLLPAPALPESNEPVEEMPFATEPNTEKLLEVLVPKVLEFTIYRALLENQAGEHAARMAAMESATRNTEELIRSLTLQFNRARQAAITKELVEIVTGAQALE